MEPKPLVTPLRRHGPAIVAILVATVPFVWMVTFGTWRLFDTELFTTFYDEQARSLLHGRWDVPFEALSFEAFVRDHKAYGYFGFVPALLRIPFVLLLPQGDGHWSRLSMTAGFVFSLAIAYALVRRLRPAPENTAEAGARWTTFVHGAFVVSLGLGSSLLFLGSRSFIYHEALMWGAAFALVSYYKIVEYLTAPPPAENIWPGRPRLPSWHSSPAFRWAVVPSWRWRCWR